MKRYFMKALIFLSTILLIPSVSLAGEFDEQINKACLRHSVSLVAKLKTNVVGDLSQEQTDEALKLATESCQAYFNREFNSGANSIAATTPSQKPEEKKDSFTERWLNTESADKKGNERLKRR